MMMRTNKKMFVKDPFVFLLLLCMVYTLISLHCVHADKSQIVKGVSMQVTPFGQENDLESLKLRAEQGDANAQCILGQFYANGQGVSQNYQEAVKWYYRAAEQGFGYAQHNLGTMYERGTGVPQNYQEAVKWYYRAAEQGLSAAQHNLGLMYERGTGVPQNYQEAVKWYYKAAEQGDASAQNNLGVMYHYGTGVAQNYQEAAKWYYRAAEQGDAVAQRNYGMACAVGHGVQKNDVVAYSWLNLAAAQDAKYAEARSIVAQGMTSMQIEEAQRLSAAFVAKPEQTEGVDTAPTAPPVTSPSRENVPTGNGTAFAISSSGYLLTSAHVVQGARRIEVYGNGNKYAAEVIKANNANDVALLKAEGAFTALALAPSSNTTLGTEVFTIGFPNVVVQGIAPKLTKGEISSLAGVQDDLRYFQISTPVQPGNSGGPLVDTRGNVIGIIAGILNQKVAWETTGTLAQNVNYAVKSAYILPLLESVPGLSDELAAATAKNSSLTAEAAIARAERATFLLLTY